MGRVGEALSNLSPDPNPKSNPNSDPRPYFYPNPNPDLNPDQVGEALRTQCGEERYEYSVLSYYPTNPNPNPNLVG